MILFCSCMFVVLSVLWVCFLCFSVFSRLLWLVFSSGMGIEKFIMVCVCFIFVLCLVFMVMVRFGMCWVCLVLLRVWWWVMFSCVRCSVGVLVISFLICWLFGSVGRLVICGLI